MRSPPQIAVIGLLYGLREYRLNLLGRYASLLDVGTALHAALVSRYVNVSSVFTLSRASSMVECFVFSRSSG